jgi:hypothetical protein
MERDETTTAAERANRKLRTDPAKELGRNARGENHELASGKDRYPVETVTPGNATAVRTLRVGGVGSRLVVTSTLNGFRRNSASKRPVFSNNSSIFLCTERTMRRRHNARITRPRSEVKQVGDKFRKFSRSPLDRRIETKSYKRRIAAGWPNRTASKKSSTDDTDFPDGLPDELNRSGSRKTSDGGELGVIHRKSCGFR